jgi:ubiquinone/menaquinone biosynthesis C-methylase UbiE
MKNRKKGLKMAATTPNEGYTAFPEIQTRDDLQVAIEVPLLVHSLRLPTAARIIEIGCGSGAALVALQRLLRPTFLAGVDLDLPLLRQAAARFDAVGVDAELLHADVRALPFADSAFDVVIDFGTCYHIAGATNALLEIARVLRPGGLFVHETPVSQHLAHPVRSFGRTLPWSHAPMFSRQRTAVLWSARRKVA